MTRASLARAWGKTDVSGIPISVFRPRPEAGREEAPHPLTQWALRPDLVDSKAYGIEGWIDQGGKPLNDRVALTEREVRGATSFSEMPWDLNAAIGYTPVMSLLLLLDDRNRLAILLVLFVSGYVFVAGLFPANDENDWIERIALSFGLSIAVVRLPGMLLNFTSPVAQDSGS